MHAGIHRAVEPAQEIAVSAAWTCLSSGLPSTRPSGDAHHWLVYLLVPTAGASAIVASPSHGSRRKGNSFRLSKVIAPSDDGTGAWKTVLPPSPKVLLFSHQRQGNNYAGFSAFRSDVPTRPHDGDARQTGGTHVAARGRQHSNRLR